MLRISNIIWDSWAGGITMDQDTHNMKLLGRGISNPKHLLPKHLNPKQLNHKPLKTSYEWS